MANFAIVKENIVENVIVAQSLEIAQEITGNTCIEYTDENPAGIGWTWNGTKFIAPSPNQTSQN